MATSKQRLGLALRMVRTVRREKLDRVAERAGIGKAHLSLIENGRRSPSLPALERLCGALGVSHVALARIAEDPEGALGLGEATP